jgi:NHLM bacteriocin system ABC transporter peptidase/ATP-binding protein
MEHPAAWKKPERRARTPTVLQMEAVECGAAALAIVLGHHGLHLPIEQLRLACGVSRDGSKASNVVKAARAFGMTASGAKLEIEALRSQAFPVIVFWNFNHFVVVEGFARDGVWLNDPATGPRKSTFDEFDRAFTGVTLLIEPGPEFKKGGARRSTFGSLLPRLEGAKNVLLFVMLASLALVIPGLAIPVFTQVFVDSYLIGQLEGWVKPLLLGMAITALLRMGLTWLQQHFLLRLELRLALTGSATFFWHLLRLPVEFFNQRHATDISQRVGSNNRVAQLLSGDLATNAVGLVTAVFYVLIMLTYDWSLTLIGVFLTGLNMAALRLVTRKRIDGNIRLQQERGKLMAATTGAIQTIETIKANGAEADFFARWAGLKAKAGNTEQALERDSRMLSSVPVLLSALTTASILGLGGWRVMEGGMTVGMLVAFQSLMGSFARPINNLMGLVTRFQDAAGDLTRLDDVLRYPVDERFDKPVAASGPGGKLEGFLEIQNLSFGYSRLDPPLIEAFDLKLAPGQRVALVGESGSGKSTIARIVMGLNKPWSGEVRIDGFPR